MTIQFSRYDIPIRRLASGAVLNIPVFRVRGNHAGKKVYLQANIHGPEIAGIGALYDLLGFLRTQTDIYGDLTIIPSVNPIGLDSKISGLQVGYIDLNDSSVANFNRIYQLLANTPPLPTPDEFTPARINVVDFAKKYQGESVETIKTAFETDLQNVIADMRYKWGQTGLPFNKKLALTIQEMAHAADLVLDLHTAGKAVHHVFTYPACFESAQYFDIPYYLELDGSFSAVLDEAVLLPWLKLHKALAEAGREIPFAEFGKEVFTLELGSADTLSAADMQQDAQRIVNYLRYHGVFTGEAVLPNRKFYICADKHYRRYYAPTGGLLLWHKTEGDTIQAGEILVTILQTYEEQAADRSQTQTPIYATADGVLLNRVESHVTQEGMTLCSVATRLETKI